MPDVGISAEVAQRQMVAASTKAKENMYTLEKQIHTRKKVNNYADLTNIGGVVETVTAKASLERAKTYEKIHATHENRLTTTIDAVSEIIDMAGEVRNFLMLKKNGASSSMTPTATMADSYLDMIAAQLNISENGRYLFSGSKTNIAPVNTPLSIQNPNLDVTLTTPNTSYYNGDSVKLTYQANDGNMVQYGVCANENGFRDIVASLFLAIKADSLGQTGLLDQAIDLTNTAIDELVAIQSRLRIASGHANLVRREQANIEETTQNRIKNLIFMDDVDIVSAITKLTQEQAGQIASYKSFNILNQMNLAQYLQ